MKWANFLHFYQPANQQKDILEAVVNQCYRPIFKGLLNKPRANLTINVSGGLFEVLDKCGFTDVINDLRLLYGLGVVEFTSTACYHAFLPLLPTEEIKRQVDLNNTLLRHYLGEDFSPQGFFPPEMACNQKVLDVVVSMGFKYILLDEIALGEKELLENNCLYKVGKSGFKVFFRQRRPSNVIMSGIERDSDNLHLLLKEYASEHYLVTAMDGETFGHHRPGLEAPFLDIFDNNDIEFSKMSDLLNMNLPSVEVSLLDSTWASSQDDIIKGIQFISWNDPSNVIHKWQWEFVNLMLNLVNGPNKEMADKALASDQFFWASGKPWWSVEMIESGAYGCLSVIEKIPGVLKADLEKAHSLYRNIVSTAFEWQRTGKIRELNKERYNTQRIPFKTRTLETGGAEAAVYKAFIDMMRAEEKKAATAGEYEKAILWRDAVYKIETKNDIYDAVSAVDLLRVRISNEKVEKIINEYKSEYNRIRGGQPEQRSN